MSALRRLIDFYRVQVELIWTWRRGRRQLVWRAITSFVVAFASLGTTAAVTPGFTIDSPVALAGAVIVIGLLSALVRPLLLSLVAPISLVLMLAASLVFQVAVLLAVVPLVPGVDVTSVADAAFASVVFATVNALLSWLLSLDSDESYYSMLVRRLVVRGPDVIRTRQPGLVIVQIDGLAHAVLTQQVNAGRVPVISRWLREEKMRLSPWIALLPSQTSASQAGIMFGNNDDIPAFRWWDKSTQTLFVSNHPADAEALEQRLEDQSDSPPLLANDGASIGNLTSGGAARAYLTMATMRDPSHGLGQSQSYFSYFLSPYGFAHSLVLGIGEMAKEIFQARRARLAGIEPRMARGFPYPFLRAVTNVVLRPVSTSLVIEEMLRGTPVIYVTYTDYDEIAHHSGPQRAESLDALDGVDRVLGSLERAAEDAPRPYHFVVLSDHGQTLGATFLQRFDKSLESVIRQLMQGREDVLAAVKEVEEWRVVHSFVSELSRARGGRAVGRRALRSKAMRAATGTREKSEAAEETPDLVVCASGNLALVYFPDIAGRADLETLNDRYPSMVEALAHHPGVGVLMVKSATHGTLAIGSPGVHNLSSGKIEQKDPLEPFGEHALAALKRLDSMTNVGDIVIISMVDESTGQVAAFEELIGSHGGLGGSQTEPLILYPADWKLDPELPIGAPMIYEQLTEWLRSIQPPKTRPRKSTKTDAPDASSADQPKKSPRRSGRSTRRRTGAAA